MSAETLESAGVIAALEAFPLFEHVPHEQLAWLAEKGTVRELAECERLHNPGQPITDTHLVLRGALRIFNPNTPAQDVWPLPVGSVTGYLPFSRIGNANAATEAAEETTLLSLPKSFTQEMAAHHFELTQALVSVMTSRVRQITAQQQQNEKMMALGKLSAGLAHELNNPIGAIASNLDYLSRYVNGLGGCLGGLLEAGVKPEAVRAAAALFVPDPAAPRLSQLARATCEEDLYDWLDDAGVPDPTELAENLAEVGTKPAALDALRQQLTPEQLTPVLNWASHTRQLSRLVEESHEAAGRVTELIKSVKIYTHMDQSPVKEPTDIHAGLRNTLTLLGHKFRQAGVQLVQEFDSSLPPVNLLVGEMNQVWTNLLDNALDAVAGRPGATLRVSTHRDREFAQVRINDNGSGIPPEVQARIFDPFFTTKEPGKGTGLGLDVVQRVIRQHNGAVKVTSEPGNTTFEVCVPIK